MYLMLNCARLLSSSYHSTMVREEVNSIYSDTIVKVC